LLKIDGGSFIAVIKIFLCLYMLLKWSVLLWSSSAIKKCRILIYTQSAWKSEVYQ